ncbi:MAG TPA: ATP-binding protein [Crocinitomicaceae bacterium]|nr:ATP-binding protein [Crocinitomicaceae bacterium]
MITRIIEKQIIESVKPQKATLIFGARRVGKTMLLNRVLEQFTGKSQLLNGEDITTQQLLEINSIKRFQDLFGDLQLLAIDEAQVIPEIGKRIKLLVDNIPGLSVIATGSSAFDLLNKTGEPLVGRASSFHLFPFSQEELSSTETAIETIKNLESRLIFGAFPELCAMETAVEKTEYLKSIVSSYMLKDILTIDGIKNSSKMLSLLQLVAFQVGSEVSYDELAKKVGLSRNTVEHYLNLLSQVFVIFRLGAYSNNLRKEISKGNKWYFYDNGIRNALINQFTSLNMRNDEGVLWENYLISERIKSNYFHRRHNEYYFWRTYDQKEIDLIEIAAGSKISAFEFKWGDKTPKVPTAFAQNYPDASYQVVNRDNYLEVFL